jgi:hypothetical protein
MKTTFPYLLILSLMLCLMACQNESQNEAGQSAPTLFADVYIRYLDAQGQYTASASFKQGDSLETAQPVVLGQAVLFQGEEMKGRLLPQGLTRYRIDNKKPYQPQHTFAFTTPDGDKEQIELSLPPIDSFEIIGGQASLSEGMRIFLHGEQLAEEERLVFLFTDAENKAESITLPGPQFEDTIFLHQLRLRKLAPGPHTLYLVKKNNLESTQGNLSVRGALEYYSDVQPFEVVE